MKRFLALESEEPNDTIDTAEVEGIQTDYDQEIQAREREELQREIEGFTDTVETVATLDTIATKLDETEAGIEPLAGNALVVVVESMLARCGVDKTNICFEEYSTRKMKFDQTKVAIESIRDTLKRIWIRLIEMIKSILNWFKRVFNMQSLRWKALDAKASKVAAKIKEEKSKPANEPVKPVEKKTITAARIARVLSEGTKVAHGEEFANSVYNHNAMIADLHKSLGNFNTEALKAAEKAVECIYKKKDVFDAALTEGLSIVVSNPIHMPKSSDQKRFGDISPSVVVFELPLVFGNKSFFRTALEHVGDLNSRDLHATVLSSTHAPALKAINEELEPLEVHVRETILDLYKEHGNKVLKLEKSRQDEVNRLYQAIQAKLAGILKRPGNEPYVGGNGKRLGNLLSMCHSLINADQVSLVDYDQSVQNAVLDYLSLSRLF